MENWKILPYFLNYEVSDSGLVRNRFTGRVLRQRDKRGYKIVSIVGNERLRADKRVHRLVAETFIGEIPPEYQVDHIDNDRSNNNLANLQIVTPRENRRNMPRRNITYIRQVTKYHDAGLSDEEIVVKMRGW